MTFQTFEIPSLKHFEKQGSCLWLIAHDTGQQQAREIAADITDIDVQLWVVLVRENSLLGRQSHYADTRHPE